MAPPARRLGAVKDHLAQQRPEPSPVSAQLAHLAPPAGDPVPLSDEEVKRFSTSSPLPASAAVPLRDTACFAQSSTATC